MHFSERTAMALFRTVGGLFLLVACVFCVLPFWLVISGSLSSEGSIISKGYGLLPQEFSFAAYKLALGNSGGMVTAYAVSTTVTLVGTVLGLFFMAMGAYVLTRKSFRIRGHLAFYVYFTSLFSGGLVPSYLLVTNFLKLTDNLLALILPLLMSPWLLLLLRNFLRSIPDSLIESAKVDGAREFTIFVRLVLPLSTPGLATIGLFLALLYWNDWFNASLFIHQKSLFPLQYYLQNIISSTEFARQALGKGVSMSIDTPSESLKMATAVLVTGPIILLYPFVQKYFVKGLTVGAVKE